MRYTIALSLASLVAVPAFAQPPRVVADIPPVHALVATVMGDLGQPELLLDRGANAHDFQLRPSQAAALSEAGLLIWIGPQMTPWLDRALDGLEAKGARLELLSAEGTHRQDFGAGGAHDHEHHAKEGADHAAGEKPDAHAGHDHAAKEKPDGHAGHDHAAEEKHDEHAGHDHSGLDPHAWLDPHNAEGWLGVIAAELSRLDPENAATYAANAAKGAAQIEKLEAELAAQLAPVKGKPFVVFHDAYGYFAGHFGLTQAGAIRLGDATSPGAARLADLRADLEAGAALCLFPEANHDAAQVAQMAEGTDVRIGGALDPAGSGLEPGAAAYGDLMRGLAGTLAECLTRP